MECQIQIKADQRFSNMVRADRWIRTPTMTKSVSKRIHIERSSSSLSVFNLLSDSFIHFFTTVVGRKRFHFELIPRFGVQKPIQNASSSFSSRLRFGHKETTVISRWVVRFWR
jgi:hypothetical protein